MCGIFGIVSKSQGQPEPFCRLAELNRQRGNLAFGYLTGREVNGRWDFRVFRHARPFEANLVHIEQAQVALGHIRAPTGGQSQDVAEVHPFETEAAWLAHNGLLLNHTAFPDWRINRTIQVDSQVILGGIQHYLSHGLPITQAIQSAVEQLDGQQACWLWHRPQNLLYLWRVMSPIYIARRADEFIFSSVKNDELHTLLPEGIIYQLEPRALAFTDVRRFAFYSPYQSG